MQNDTNKFAALFIVIIMSLSLAAGALAIAPETGNRAGNDRATSIDGFHEDEFDLPANVSMKDDATVDDG